MLDRSKPHTVAVVTSLCRLPTVRGRLAPGVYHFAGDLRPLIQSTYWRKQLRSNKLYYLAGDTPEVLRTIAAMTAPLTAPALPDADDHDPEAPA